MKSGKVEFEVRQGEAEVRSREVEVSSREVEHQIHKCWPGFAIPASSLAIVWLFALPRGEIPLYICKVFGLPLLLDDQRFLCDVPSQPSDPEVRHVPCAVLIYSRSPQETFLRKRDRKIICPSIVFISGFPWYLYRKSIVTCILNCEQMNNITLNINRFFLGNVWTTSFFHCLIFRTVHSKQFATLSIYWLKFFFMISYKFFLIILGIGENWSNIHGLNVVNVNQGQMPTLRRMNFGKVPNPLTFGKSCCSISVGDFWGLPNQADVDPALLGLV